MPAAWRPATASPTRTVHSAQPAPLAWPVPPAGPAHDPAVPRPSIDALVVGSGPNGLAAAITLARAGLGVRVYEAAPDIGGGLRSASLTLPGFVHDPCASVMALAPLSPFFGAFGPGGDGEACFVGGAELIRPPIAVGHVLSPDRAVLLHASIAETAAGLGRDGPAWRRLFVPLVEEADRILPWVLGPLLRPPRHPLAVARFAAPAGLPAVALGRLVFRDAPARALLGGLAAHAAMPLEAVGTAGFALVLGLAAHMAGWPVVQGGSQRLADALVAELGALGGEVVTGMPIRELAQLPPARAVLLDVAPRALVGLAGDRLSPRRRRALASFRAGPGAAKVDWALDGPIPWRAADLAQAGTVHLGGSLGHLAASERAVARGRVLHRSFAIVVQAGAADPSRAPAGKQTAWAYTHVPNGSPLDPSPLIEAAIEEAAPGFRDRILARRVHTAPDLEGHDPNLVGGDVGGGRSSLRQLLARPVLARDPYATGAPGLYLCSASTPPGGGIHGMCGYLAARSALRREFGISSDPLGID